MTASGICSVYETKEKPATNKTTSVVEGAIPKLGD